jgi:chemotaxis methyl-accepting protein methylase
MHKLMTGGAILEHELSELRLLVERQTGILLDCPNSALTAHISDYLESHQQLESASILLERLRTAEQDASVLPEFLDGLINSTTGFFRHPSAMSALSRHILPQLHARKSADGSGMLRIWSAGCGSGEEAYSIAMAICDGMAVSGSNGAGGGSSTNGNGREKSSVARSGGIAESSLPPSITKDWSIHIVGSDLLPSSIEFAERGLYPQSALAGLPPATIRACFSKIGSASAGSNGSQNGNSSGSNNGANGSAPAPNAASHLLVKPRLRSLVTFNTMNLAKPVYIGRFDCIFCMDVLPHLSRAHRTALLERLHLYLEPGGYLFLSQTEKLSAPNLNFRSEIFDGYTFHRKPLAASAAYGR